MAGVVLVALLACEKQAGKAPKPDPVVSGPLVEVGRRLKEAGEPLVANGPKEEGPNEVETDEVDDGADDGVDEPEKPEAPLAKAVAGKPGFVYSPHTEKIVDVSGFAVGELVVDPDFAEGEKKYFRVPEPVPSEEEKVIGEPGTESIPAETDDAG